MGSRGRHKIAQRDKRRRRNERNLDRAFERNLRDLITTPGTETRMLQTWKAGR